MSDNAIESEWCRNEILDCLKEKKGYLIPVYIEQVKLRFGLRVSLNHIEYYDLSDESTKSNSINRLIESLRIKVPGVFKKRQKDDSALHYSRVNQATIFDKGKTPNDSFSIKREFFPYEL